MSLEQGKFSGHLNTFEFEGTQEKVSFVKTDKVTRGVECDVYKFDGDQNKDLGIIRIEAGYKTPLQKVLTGDRTIEGYISGKGRFILARPNVTAEYSVEAEADRSLYVAVQVGDKMQWQADVKSPLVVYEVCFPPYQDGRFENLSE